MMNHPSGKAKRRVEWAFTPLFVAALASGVMVLVGPLLGLPLEVLAEMLVLHLALAGGAWSVS